MTVRWSCVAETTRQLIRNGQTIRWDGANITMSTYILAHDLGTSGNKATLFSADGQLIASVMKKYPTFYPKPGYVEQNPRDWWDAVVSSTRELLKQSDILPGDIACISFSAQMMGCLLVDDAGNPLHNMLIWADTRAAEQERAIIDRLGMQNVYQMTGHRASSSYSAAKLLWLKEHEPELFSRAYKFLNAKDFIIHKMTGAFVTDFSDASGTNLLDIRQLKWSSEIVHALELDEKILPELHASTDIAGKLTKEAADACGLVEGIPVVMGGGDGSCACVGAGVVQEGKAYNVLGSSSWISAVSSAPIYDPGMRTFNWVHLDKSLYTPCGTMQAAGYSYQWFRDTLCPGDDYKQVNSLAKHAPPGANGILFLPYLLGERSPRWDYMARGAFIGLGISSTRGDMARAVLEGVAMNLRIILEILEKECVISDVTAIGGGANSLLWLQIMSDVWKKPLNCIKNPSEATSMGAAICGGVSLGLLNSFADSDKFIQKANRIQPNPENAKMYDFMFKVFDKAYDGLYEVNQDLYENRVNGKE